MSLRRDIHSAFESIAPPVGGMPERVVQTVLADGRGRRRKETMMLRFQMPLALVATVLLLVVAAAALLTWNGLRSRNVSPAGVTLAQLEARPLLLPAFQSQSMCKSGPLNAESSLGAGPVSLEPSGTSWHSSWGYYNDYLLYADTRIAGPILVRARDLFTPAPVVFVGLYAAGPVVGTDVLDGPARPQRAELSLDVGHAKAGIDAHGTRHPFVWNFTAGVAQGWSGSSGWQIDGGDFSEVFVSC